MALEESIMMLEEKQSLPKDDGMPKSNTSLKFFYVKIENWNI